MKILREEKIEDCFDGSGIFLYYIDQAWTEESISSLKTLGKLEYYNEFPRPFFRLITTRGLQVKGVVGEASCRVILPRESRQLIRDELIATLTETKV